MSREFLLVLKGLAARYHLRSTSTSPQIEQQLKSQKARPSASDRYEVVFDIVEGRGCPALDLDNYTKPTLDAITRTQLLWRDDRQIDVQIVRRTRDRARDCSDVSILVRRMEGQHGGVPSFFRALCYEAASSSHPTTYRDAGYHLAMHLSSQQPYDIDEKKWATQLERLHALLEDENTDAIWHWFCRHFPRCMQLVPKRRLLQFAGGVIGACQNGRMNE